MTDSKPFDVTCFGAAHVDLIAKAEEPLIARSSTPGNIRQAIGGVAGNVARQMSRRGVQVAMVSQTGDDREADFVRDVMTEEGVDVSGIIRNAAERTGSYLAIEDPEGEMALAVSDTHALQNMRSSDLINIAKKHLQSTRWFLDANLTTEMQDVLINLDQTPAIAIDAVSVAKVIRLRDHLKEFALLFCNREEAEALFQQKFETTQEAGQAMADHGVAASVVTDGPRPLCVQSGAALDLIDIPPVEVASVTGAGDASIAGTLAALVNGQDLPAAAKEGISAAAKQLSGK